jgi:two-component system KDP operon response regulator KdpE
MIDYTVLVIDDEVQIRKLLRIILESNDYKVIEAENAKEGLLLAANHPPDLILLDIGLPDKSGHRVLSELREWYKKPILMLSVQNSEEDIVSAIDNGADDYLIKPFRTGELLARIRAAIRRKVITETEPELTFDDMVIDLPNHIVKKNGEVVKLTSTEYNLLALFVTNPGKVLTHQYLLREIWGPTHQTETQYLRVFIATLRKKIESNPNAPKHILTETGIGYRFT